MPLLRGIIFDLDGTLVDSGLDFNRMREEIGIPSGHSVLEFVQALPPGAAKRSAEEILLRHEFEGAARATLMPGVDDLIATLCERRISQGILTRNLAGPTRLTLNRLKLHHFSPVITREDAPPKPDPAGLREICARWTCDSSEVLFVGDYRFDLQAGKRAGMKTILYSPGPTPSYASDANHVVSNYADFAREFESILSQLGFTFATSDRELQ